MVWFGINCREDYAGRGKDILLSVYLLELVELLESLEYYACTLFLPLHFHLYGNICCHCLKPILEGYINATECIYYYSVLM